MANGANKSQRVKFSHQTVHGWPPGIFKLGKIQVIHAIGRRIIKIERATYLIKNITAKAIKVRNPKKLKMAVKRTLVKLLANVSIKLLASGVFWSATLPIPTASLKTAKEFVGSKWLADRKASVTWLTGLISQLV